MLLNDSMLGVDLNTAARKAKAWRALIESYPEHAKRYENNAECYEAREDVLLADE